MSSKKVVNISDSKANLHDVFFDSWDNFLSDVGESFSGKVNRFQHKANKRLSQQQLDEMFASDSIAVKLCSKPAEDMTRQGIDIDHKKAGKVYDFYDKYNLIQLLEEQLTLDRFYGGACMVLDLDDGSNGDFSQPLNESNIRGINELYVLDRFFFTPMDAYNPIREPERYYLNGYEKQTVIHKSRLIKMKGLFSGTRNSIINQSFGECVPYRCIQELRNFGFGHEIVPEILLQFITNIFKFKKFTEMVSNGKGSIVKKKAAYLQAAKSLFGALVIDQEDDFIAKTINVSGIDKLIDMIERRLCAAAGMPHTHLLEEGTSTGLSNNGSNTQESQQWYDYIKSQQVKKLSPALNRLNFIISKILKLGTDNQIKWEFCSLKQQSEMEKTDTRLKVAQTQEIYNKMGLPANLILEQTFGQGYYSSEMSFSKEQLSLLNKIAVNAGSNK